MVPRAKSRRSTVSAGILAYRKGARGLEVLLAHPGGPFWRNKDSGAWSIPKGEIDGLDDPEQVARREFAEELGPCASIGRLQELVPTFHGKWVMIQHRDDTRSKRSPPFEERSQGA